ncbi:hypothetical protein RvY_04941-1 [Ramazzottius varieornatus]|uniref:G-protein coupled receptors family 1 profile domain-containing protein n=1 Tax=Ramazzottius varieornatus TaxID=947166 RepID=A0A1D1V385_RAMVA|nr:hypothetical protein RvY_04941-1 [Ramazzottius varieornatus]
MLILYWRIYLVASKHSKSMREERERFASLAQQLRGFDETRGRNLSLESNEPNEIRSDHRVSRVTIQSSETPLAEHHGLPKDSIPNAKKIGFSKKLRRMSKDKKAAKTLFIVMACFVGCWFPFFTVYFIDGVCKEICNIPSWVFKSFFWLGYCNSMLVSEGVNDVVTV